MLDRASKEQQVAWEAVMAAAEVLKAAPNFEARLEARRAWLEAVERWAEKTGVEIADLRQEHDEEESTSAERSSLGRSRG